MKPSGLCRPRCSGRRWLRLRTGDLVNNLEGKPSSSSTGKTPPVRGAERQRLDKTGMKAGRFQSCQDSRAGGSDGGRLGWAGQIKGPPPAKPVVKCFDLLITPIYPWSSLRQKNRPERPAFEGKPGSWDPQAEARPRPLPTGRGRRNHWAVTSDVGVENEKWQPDAEARAVTSTGLTCPQRSQRLSCGDRAGAVGGWGGAGGRRQVSVTFRLASPCISYQQQRY